MTQTLDLPRHNTTKPGFYRHLRRRLRLLVSTRPALYALYARFEKLQFQLTDKTTVVVDSYPRSGNSFFEAAFTRAHCGREEVAHHAHAAAQVLAGAKRGLPCIVLLREPEAAIASFVKIRDCPCRILGPAIKGEVRGAATVVIADGNIQCTEYRPVPVILVPA